MQTRHYLARGVVFCGRGFGMAFVGVAAGMGH